MIETGISFNDIHSYYDLNLILSKVDVPPAEPKITYIDIPGGDGSVDLTEAHSKVNYYDRNCEFTFTMHPLDQATWEEKKTEISNALNGKVFRVTLDKDDDFYYLGRCTVSDYTSDKKIRQIVVTAKVKPYKFKQSVTLVSFALSEMPQVAIVTNGRKPVVPEITCTDDNVKIIFGDRTYMLSAGTSKILNICFVEGNNEMTLSGSGTITFKYQEGEL